MKSNLEPLVYTPEDIQRLTGRGRRQTYELLQENRFPVKKVGRGYIIPKEPFHKWLVSDGLYNLKTMY